MRLMTVKLIIYKIIRATVYFYDGNNCTLREIRKTKRKVASNKIMNYAESSKFNKK